MQKQGYGLTKGNVHPTKPNKSLLSNSRYRQAATPQWSDVGVKDHADEIRDLIKANPGSKFEVDHDLPIKAKSGGKRIASGLNVFDNTSPMEASLNNAKRNNVPEEFLEYTYKRNPQTGRLDGFNNAGLRVPRSQGGFINAGLLKNIGNVGLLGAAEMGLNYLAPDNPVNQAREQGYGSLKELGLDIEGGIANIENPMLRGSAHLANGLLADPLITAYGAGNWMGDRIQQELRGERATNQLKRGKQGMMGRFNRASLL